MSQRSLTGTITFKKKKKCGSGEGGAKKIDRPTVLSSCLTESSVTCPHPFNHKGKQRLRVFFFYQSCPKEELKRMAETD